MRPRPSPGLTAPTWRRPAFVVALFAATLLLTVSACDESPVTQLQEPDLTLEWPGRYKTTLRSYEWASFRDISGSRFDDEVAAYSSDGFILINTGAAVTARGVRYSMVWRENPENRGWTQDRDMTSAQYGSLWSSMRDQGYRPLDIEAWDAGGGLRYSGIWIDNLEDIGWASRRDMTGTEYGAWFQEQRDAGRRPVDIEVYSTADGPRVAAIWYENVGDLAWVQRRDMTRASYQTEAEVQNAAGYKMMDFESYRVGGTQYYAAIWIRPEEGYASQVRTNRNAVEYGNLWRQYRDEGYRVLEVEQYERDGTVEYGGIWAENAERYRFPDRGSLDQAVESYQQNQGPSGAIPGISVAIVQDGEMVYRRGFGRADVAGDKVAHGETVYLAASVSKVIGATLAARLEAEGQLRDGTTVNLDLSDPTSDYLPGLPSWHTHTLEQLASHAACVPHYACSANPGTGYCSYPGISNGTLAASHYPTAQGAATAVWGTALIDSVWTGSAVSDGCSVGTTRRYSTHGFTLLGAAMEAASGRPLDDLVDSELTRQFGLESLRVMFADPTLPGDYDRAVPYDNSGNAIQHSDNSWKVFGGGIEVTTVDLARFGWKVLSGEIVDATTRDTRLLAPVNCAGRGGGVCFNGLGWQLDTDGSGRTIAEHGGSWTGARTHLRLYEDDGLVIAVMSNQRGHDPSTLVEQLGDIILP